MTSAQGRGGAGNAAHPRGLSPAVRRSRAAPGTRARVSHTRGAGRSLPEHVRRSFRCGRPARPTCPWAEAGAARRRLERLSGPRERGFRGPQPGCEGSWAPRWPLPVSAPTADRSHDRLCEVGVPCSPHPGDEMKQSIKASPALLTASKATPSVVVLKIFFPLKPYFLNPNSQLGE